MKCLRGIKNVHNQHGTQEKSVKLNFFEKKLRIIFFLSKILLHKRL